MAYDSAAPIEQLIYTSRVVKPLSEVELDSLLEA